jgi:hypothetical protein
MDDFQGTEKYSKYSSQLAKNTKKKRSTQKRSPAQGTVLKDSN